MRFLALLLLLSSPLLAAEPVTLSASEQKALVQQAKVIADAFKAGDADTLIKATHPAIEKLFGSREVFETTSRDAIRQFASQVKLESMEYGKPTAVYDAGTDDICFLPTSSVYVLGDKRLKSTGFLIAGRAKGSADWRFLDSAALRKDPAMLGTLFPGLPKDIALPPNTIEELKP